MTLDRQQEERIRHAAAALADATPVGTEFDELTDIKVIKSDRRFNGGLVSGSVFLVVLALGIGLGWLASPATSMTTDDPFNVGTITSAAVPDTTRVPYANAADAAIASALDQEPDLVDPQVTRIVGIHAGESVDLRIQVQADGFCHWYGVGGFVQNGVLEWRSGPALACDR